MPVVPPSGADAAPRPTGLRPARGAWGQALGALIAQQGLTQAEVARRAGLSAGRISQLVHGDSQDLKATSHRLLAQALGFPSADALEDVLDAAASRRTRLLSHTAAPDPAQDPDHHLARARAAAQLEHTLASLPPALQLAVLEQALAMARGAARAARAA